jgi:hypothetical protein
VSEAHTIYNQLRQPATLFNTNLYLSIIISSRGARGEKSPDINFLHNARPEETNIPDSLKQYFTLVSTNIRLPRNSLKQRLIYNFVDIFFTEFGFSWRDF